MLMCHKRAVPALDNYWNRMEPIIMARFEYVMRQNVESVRMCDPTKFKQDMNPHYVRLPSILLIHFTHKT